MAKQQIQQKETVVAAQDGIGKQTERTVTLDDSNLPSPQELEAYGAVNPRIVDFLIDAAIKEQSHRHEMDKEKISIVRRSDTSERRMNWWGMFFAFMSIVVLGGCTCWALYLDRPWFAGLLGTGTLITIVAMFVNRGGQTSQRKK